VFDREWVLAHMPDAELRRQKAAYRAGILRATALNGAVAAALATLSFVAVGNARRADTLRQKADENAAAAKTNAARAESSAIKARREAERANRSEVRARTEAERARAREREREQHGQRRT
jgi:hypothetical protein